MNAHSAINAYRDVGLETSVMSADPHKLIALLYEGALLAIAKARTQMLANQTAEKGSFISKAIAIIGEGLNASLDKNVGGELAHNLSALYTYMVTRLVDANLKNDVAALDEVTRMLVELKGAWDAIRPQVVKSAAVDSAPTVRTHIQA
jgi:flagellar protein FliS